MMKCLADLATGCGIPDACRVIQASRGEVPAIGTKGSLLDCSIMVDAEDRIKLIDFGIAAKANARRLTFGKLSQVMRAADLVVTKAGPGAISEALATGVPLVLTGYLPGQETANVRFVTESGLGVYATRPEELRQAVSRLLEGGGRDVSAMASRAAAMARPYASLDIARECLAIASRYAGSREAGGPGVDSETVPVGESQGEASEVEEAHRNGPVVGRRRRWTGWGRRNAATSGEEAAGGAGAAQGAATTGAPEGDVRTDEAAGERSADDSVGGAPTPPRSPEGRGRKGYRASSQARR